MLVPSLIFRLVNTIKKRKLWLVAEEGEARDNGYYFYKYVRENHPDDYCFYAIKKTSAGYKKVTKLGNVIEYGSLKHWLYYMSANLNISSQTVGNPNVLFWYFIHVILGLYRNRVFLQHGIIMNDVSALYYKRTKFKYFICGAEMEYREVSTKYGYPSGSIVLTGLPRWDYLKNKPSNRKSILIMPTWRQYLEHENGTNFRNSVYYTAWNGLLNDKAFTAFIEKNDIDVYFYPHRNMQPKLSMFNATSKNIKMISIDKDIAHFFSKCSLMITDYSSVAFDFAYLEKPVIYYQFDQTDFRKGQHAEGYFSYEKDGFGPVVTTPDDLHVAMVAALKDGLSTKYSNRIKKNRMYNFSNNCSERIYNILIVGGKNAS